jgi:hypothetical protein
MKEKLNPDFNRHYIFAKQDLLEAQNAKLFEVEKGLKSLGNSASEIAKSLKKLNMKGEILNVCQCPVSNFIKRKMGKLISHVNVQHVLAEVTFTNDRTATIVFSRSMTKFLKDFDESKHPELFYAARERAFKRNQAKFTREQAKKKHLKKIGCVK